MEFNIKHWMHTVVFVVVIIPAALLGQISQKISTAEYYWSHEPQQLFTIDITDSAIVQFSENISAPQTEGEYTLFVRLKDNNGQWGAFRGISIEVTPNPRKKIIAGEYYWDDDSLTTNSFVINSDTSSVEVSEDITVPFTEGVHTLYVRLQDNDGKEGAFRGITVSIDSSQQQVLVRGEYFWQSRPSIRLPLEISSREPIVEITETIQAPTTLGKETLYIRLQDNDSEFGAFRGLTLNIEQITPPPAIAAAEYFFDVDPGQGQGINPENLLLDGVTAEIADTVSTLSLTDGHHKVITRFQNNRGEWGPADTATFVVGAFPIIQTQDWLSFGSLVVGDTLSKDLWIKNGGNDTLLISDIILENVTEFRSDRTSEVIPPQDSSNFKIRFEPLQSGNKNSNLTIQNNDDIKTLSIFAEAIDAPEISLSLTSNLPNILPVIRDVIIEIQSNINLGTEGGAKLYYRAGGERVYQPITMSSNELSYSATISSGMLTSRGLQFYVEATDGNTIGTLPSVNPTTSPFSYQTSFPNEEKLSDQPVGDNQNNYRIISIPFILDNRTPSNVLSDFGPADSINGWRLFGWQEGEYVEHYESNFETFSVGLAFWFLTTQSGRLRSGGAKSLPPNQEFPIQLEPGWNLISAPFNYAIDWQDVIKSENIEPPFTFGVGGYRAVDKLEQWEGYFVKNQAEAAETISIIPNESLSAKEKFFAKDTFNRSDNSWEIQVSVRSEEIADNYNSIGVSNEAAHERDQFDVIEPPKQIGKHLSLYFPHQDWLLFPDHYSRDIRPVPENGVFWDFEIVGSSLPDSIELLFTLPKNLSSEFQTVLIHKNKHVSQLVEDKIPYHLSFNAHGEIFHQLRLVVGNRDFIRENNLGISVIPDKFKLWQNYPNPFNPETNIRFQLPVEANVKLFVYNGIGQIVRELESGSRGAGYHQVSWDGKNEFGQKVSSGIYFYKLEVSSSQSRIFQRVKKMLLLK